MMMTANRLATNKEKTADMTDLLQNHRSRTSGPVECLGQTFASDDARRAHFLTLLAEKLEDPAFRKQAGFPKGSDVAILAASPTPPKDEAR